MARRESCGGGLTRQLSGANQIFATPGGLKTKPQKYRMTDQKTYKVGGRGADSDPKVLELTVIQNTQKSKFFWEDTLLVRKHATKTGNSLENMALSMQE